MAAQSRPTILITRPLPQAIRFARALRATDWAGAVHVSPLMAPAFRQVTLPQGRFQAVILTSETGAKAAATVTGLPRMAFCVGDRTAQTARRAGFQTQSARGDAKALLAMIQAAKPQGRLLLLQGQETAGDLQSSLHSAGIETDSLILYAQVPQPLSARAKRLIQSHPALVLPVFSPRTASILCQEWLALPPPKAAAHVFALSPAIATVMRSIDPAALAVAASPDGDSLLEALKETLQSQAWA